MSTFPVIDDMKLVVSPLTVSRRSPVRGTFHSSDHFEHCRPEQEFWLILASHFSDSCCPTGTVVPRGLISLKCEARINQNSCSGRQCSKWSLEWKVPRTG